MSLINRYTLLKAFHTYKSLNWHDYVDKGVYFNLWNSKLLEQELSDLLDELRSEGLIKLQSVESAFANEITEDSEKEYQKILTELQDQQIKKKLELALLTANKDIAEFQKGVGKRYTIAGFWLALFAFIVSIIAVVVTHNDTRPQPFPYDTTTANARIKQLEQRLRTMEQKAKAADTIRQLKQKPIR